MCIYIDPLGSLSVLENPGESSGSVWLPVDQVWKAQFQQRLGAPLTPNNRTVGGLDSGDLSYEPGSTDWSPFPVCLFFFFPPHHLSLLVRGQRRGRANPERSVATPARGLILGFKNKQQRDGHFSHCRMLLAPTMNSCRVNDRQRLSLGR